MNDLAFEHYQLIGFDTSEEELEYSDFYNYYTTDPDHLQVWIDSFGPDYNDPYSMLIMMYDPESYYNAGQIDNAEVVTLLEQALNEPDTEKRLEIYEYIQYILFEKEMVQAPLYSKLIQYVHAANIENFPYNKMARLYIWHSLRS